LHAASPTSNEQFNKVRDIKKYNTEQQCETIATIVKVNLKIWQLGRYWHISIEPPDD
jgi:hypothetical protein